MYVPPAYRARAPRDLVARHPFAVLVTAGPSGLCATSLPLCFETDADDDMRLVGHLSRANPHADALADGVEALALFSGPDAYVSAGWYAVRPTVPTWNYVAVQARGRLSPIDDDAEQIALLERLIARSEIGGSAPWTLDDAPDGAVARLLPRIRSFRITVSALDGAEKLSQNYPAGDQARVVAALLARGAPDDLAIAEAMRAVGADGSND